MLKPEFKELWDRIKHKTRYAVTSIPKARSRSVLPELDAATIRSAADRHPQGRGACATTKDMFEAMAQSGARTALDLAGRFPLPNLLEVMESLMENTSPPMRM